MLVRMLVFSAVAALLTAAEEPIMWPNLPTSGFIRGKAATVADVENDNAVFFMNEQSEGAWPLTIPRYVEWADEFGVDHPMILIQAEQAPGGLKMVGLRAFNGQATVATLPEVKLLGTEKPH